MPAPGPIASPTQRKIPPRWPQPDASSAATKPVGRREEHQSANDEERDGGQPVISLLDVVGDAADDGHVHHDQSHQADIGSTAGLRCALRRRFGRMSCSLGAHSYPSRKGPAGRAPLPGTSFPGRTPRRTADSCRARLIKPPARVTSGHPHRADRRPIAQQAETGLKVFQNGHDGVGFQRLLHLGAPGDPCGWPHS